MRTVLGYQSITIPTGVPKIVHLGVTMCVPAASSSALDVAAQSLNLHDSCTTLRVQHWVHPHSRHRGMRVLRVDLEAVQVLRADKDSLPRRCAILLRAYSVQRNCLASVAGGSQLTSAVGVICSAPQEAEELPPPRLCLRALRCSCLGGLVLFETGALVAETEMRTKGHMMRRACSAVCRML